MAKIPAVIRALPAGTTLWRIYFQGGSRPTRWQDFRRFGPTQNRFDHHLAPPRTQARAIFYGAVHGLTCFAEVFQESREIDVRQHAPVLVAFITRQPLTLLDLRGAWPTRAGGSLAISAGERRRSRRWSRAIYGAYPKLHGLWYGSSMHASRPAVALYERAARAMPVLPIFHRQLSDPAIAAVVARAAAQFNYDVC